jgi:hypothetical protein
VLAQLDVVGVPGAHALNYSDLQLIAELIDAHIADEPLVTSLGGDMWSGRQALRITKQALAS